MSFLLPLLFAQPGSLVLVAPLFDFCLLRLQLRLTEIRQRRKGQNFADLERGNLVFESFGLLKDIRELS